MHCICDASRHVPGTVPHSMTVLPNGSQPLRGRRQHLFTRSVLVMYVWFLLCIGMHIIIVISKGRMSL
jgi:hypothetical protein